MANNNNNKLKVWESAPVEWQKYDLCLVFPVDFYTQAIREDAVVVIKRLAKLLGKKYLYVYYSQDGRRVYALIRAGLRFLRAKAISEGWQLRLDEDLCRMLASQHNASAHFDESLIIPHFSEVTYIGPYEYIYLNYQQEETIEKLFQRTRNMQHPFRKSLRLQMLIDFLTRNMKENSTQFMSEDVAHTVVAAGVVGSGGGAAGGSQEYALNHLKSQGIIMNAFAIPDITERNEIAYKMLTIFPHLMPVEDLHGYFGEKITLYFAFLDYICRWLFIPAMIGIGVETSSLVFFNFSRHEVAVFSFFIMLYFITTLEHWRREQYFWSLRWNTLGSTYEDTLLTAKDIRPQYFGIRIKSYIDGKETIYYPDSRRYGWYFVSLLVLVFCILCVFAAQAAIYYLRWQLSILSIISPQEQWIASGISGAQIILCNYLYSSIAMRTTEWENHRLEVHFERALIVKTVIFQFCNVLATFYYLAFAARYVPKHNQPEESIGECGFDSCMIPLAVNTLVIMSTEVGWRWISRFLWPYVSYHVLSSCCGMYSERRAEDHAYNPYAAILQNAPSAYNRDKMQSSFYSSPSKSMKKEEEADFNMGAIYGAGSDDEEQNRKPTVTSPTSKKFTISSPSKKVQNPHPSDSFYNPSLSADNLAQSPPASPTRSLTRNKSMMSERSNADDRSVVSTKDSPMRRQLAAAIAAERNKKEGKPASSVVGSSLSSKTSFQPAPVEVRSPAPLAPISPMAASDDNANNQNNSSNRTEASHQFSNPMRANIAKYAIVKPPVQQNSSVTGGSALHVIVEEKDAQSEVDHKSAGIPSLQKPALSSGNRKESTFFNADSEARSPHSPQDWQSYVNAQQSVKLVQRADRNKSLRERSAFSRSMDDDETQLESAELGKGVGGENNAESDEDVAQDYDVMNPFESFTTHNYDYLREGLDNYSQFIRILLITICFGSSLPAVFLIFLVYVGIEIRGQTWLLCFHYPRPLPEVCEDIGVWMAIFQVVLAIGTFTNASLVILTMDQFQHWPIAYRLALWIGYAVVLLAYQFFLHKVYHGIPSEVLIQKQRALFLSTQLNSSSNAKATEYDQQAIATEML